MKISYLGPAGTFSEEAARRYFNETDDITWHMFDSLIEVIESVGEGDIDSCIVPIENSIEGTINVTVDAMISNDLIILSEIILPVHLHLLAKEETQIEDIVEVRSINPALAQCRDFIKKIKAKCRTYESTSFAAASINEESRINVAAIASEWTAKQHRLKILVRDIQDNFVNHTKFVLLSKNTINTGLLGDKIMLLIQPGAEHPGLLSSILNIFSTLSINLTWIESRPTKKKLGTYQFLIEAENERKGDITKAIKILKTLEHKVHVLGCYNSKELQ